MSLFLCHTVVLALVGVHDDDDRLQNFYVSIYCHLTCQHGHPYISAMVSNGSLHYDHDVDGTHTSLNGCEANMRGVQHETYIAIRYEHDRLTVGYKC